MVPHDVSRLQARLMKTLVNESRLKILNRLDGCPQCKVLSAEAARAVKVSGVELSPP
jgi:hypothetical protein